MKAFPNPRTIRPIVMMVAISLVISATSPGSLLSRYAQRTLGLLYTGAYEEAEEYGEQVLSYGIEDADVAAAVIDAEMALGKYEEAADTASNTSETFESYIPMQLKAIDALRAAGREEEVREMLEGLDALAKTLDPKALSSRELAALGRAALLLGAEPKMVHSEFFQKARRADPENLEAALAGGQLAIDKGDYALAARILGEARNEIGPMPDILHLLARAHSPSDRVKAEELIDLALDRNPRHVPSLLLRAEHAIDGERYDLANETLITARSINPKHPRAWALVAAIDFILDNTEDAEEGRRKALEPWPRNPEVDYLIGLKVSQKRRFDEGSDFLRRSLEFDPDHLGAKKVLGQNLLRLGAEEEGWALLETVQEADRYDVEVFNLMLLHDQLEGFTSIEAGGFVVRMTAHEASVYGARVVELLEQASEALCEKYGFTPPERVVVDFFPDQQDFAIRTIGMPGGLGIVGACFGNVVAMNSPGSAGSMGTNWESTLWHEYCHTVTLGATRNRIPRWYTEGISVYEERLRDKSCGQKMNSGFRKRILSEDGLIPVAELSSALTAFNDPDTISFAYYQASILVEYMIETFGRSAVKRSLADLRDNADVEAALARRMTELESLEAGFTKFAKSKARKVAPGADWETPENDGVLQHDPEGVKRFLRRNPNSIWALIVHTSHLLGERRWEEAKAPSQKLIDLYPEYIGAGNGYASLALACRNLDDPDGERDALRTLAERDSDAGDAFLRLIDLGIAEEDWDLVQSSARRQLALNPMLREPHRALGIAAQAQGDSDSAIRAFESLLQLDPAKPADAHFRLAELHRSESPDMAKRHLLLAIDEAPRFRSAHRMLLELLGDTSSTGASDAAPAETSTPPDASSPTESP